MVETKCLKYPLFGGFFIWLPRLSLRREFLAIGKEVLGVDQSRAPLYEALVDYEKEGKISFHVPGHKDGKDFDEEGKQRFFPLLSIDGTEVNGLDDLHHPTGAIKEAQELAAEIFGGDWSFFLVGGSTAGNLAAALSVVKPGDQILVQRNSHKSIFHGLMLAGAKPVYMVPEIHQESGIPLGISPHVVQEGLSRFPEVKGVWITSPNYYGMGMDIGEIAKMTREKGIPLIVDEAHGAHFGQVPGLPPSALQLGADLVVQSTHKMLSSMTMSSMLHGKGNRVNKENIGFYLSIIQSSSPSYPLMASLDLARRHLYQRGRNQLSRGIILLQKKKEELKRRLNNIRIFSLPENAGFVQDPFKWVISSAEGQLTGYELLDYLERKGCVAEMADTGQVVLALSAGIQENEIDDLTHVLLTLDRELMSMEKKEPQEGAPMPGQWVQPALSLREALDSQRKRVPLQESKGKICGEMIIPYPPGVPFLVPGEIIKEEHIQHLLFMKERGIVFQGAGDDSLSTIAIVMESTEL